MEAAEPAITEMGERLWAEIDLSALAHNLAQVRRQVGPHVAVMGLVKADAYGHGAVPIARELSRLGVRHFCVASPEEALELRASEKTEGLGERPSEAETAGVESAGASMGEPGSAIGKASLLILGGTLPEEADAVFEAGAAVTISDAEVARGFAARAVTRGLTLPVHLKIDTGMGRLGVRAEKAVDLAIELAGLRGVRLEGLLTHFPAAAEDPDFTESQIALFDRLCREIAARGIAVPLRHTANSAAVGAHPKSFFNAVRPGISLYGYDPLPPDRRSLHVRPVLSLKTRIVLLKRYVPGDTIGYGRTYVVQQELLAAVVPIGYADGLNRLLSNRGEMLVRGCRAPILGRVSMDQAALDVTRVPGVSLGDEVVVLGRQGDEKIDADDHARLCNTLPHEILTGLGRRVKRLYRPAG